MRIVESERAAKKLRNQRDEQARQFTRTRKPVDLSAWPFVVFFLGLCLLFAPAILGPFL